MWIQTLPKPFILLWCKNSSKKECKILWKKEEEVQNNIECMSLIGPKREADYEFLISFTQGFLNKKEIKIDSCRIGMKKETYLGEKSSKHHQEDNNVKSATYTGRNTATLPVEYQI